MTDAYDFQLQHNWGGAYAYPLSQRAQAFVDQRMLMPASAIWDDPWTVALSCDHRDGLAMAEWLVEQGYSFYGMDLLKGTNNDT